MTSFSFCKAALRLALASALAFGVSFHVWAANSVTTKTVQVPEEQPETEAEPSTPAPAPTQETEPEIDEESVEERTIPDEALPTLNPDDQAVSPEPEIEPDPNATSHREGEPAVIQHDINALPEPVKRMRELILEAAKSGDIEKLRNLIGTGETQTSLSIGGLEGDPIDFLKEASGDSHGYEILAILIEVLEAGYVHMDEGKETELYIWPYFFAVPLHQLLPPQRVELFRILTAGDVQDSEEFGAYVFYRVGIKPDGQWNFFVAGD